MSTGFRRLAKEAGVSTRLCSGAGLARLRAEARLIRRYPHEYRRLLPLGGHADAIRSLVRIHGRQYDGFLLEAVMEHERLFSGGNGVKTRSGGAGIGAVAARAR